MGVDLGKLLGRIHVHDPRDADYPVALRLAAAPMAVISRRSRFWLDSVWWGDQSKTPPSATGDHPYCVGFSSAHWLADGPVYQPPPKGARQPAVDPLWIYAQAQNIDEFPGVDYDGTTVRAAMKVLQSAGYIGEYHWAQTVDELAQAVLLLGPAVLGTSWWNSMFTPDRNGFVTCSGPIVGGHAWVANGVDLDARFFRCKNSWGRDWGSRGHFFVSFDTMAQLLAKDGEACIAHEVSRGALKDAINV